MLAGIISCTARGYKSFIIGSRQNYNYEANAAEKRILVEEVKIGCTIGMLQGLDDESRITYVVGEILEFNSTDGPYIQNITLETLRKRLQELERNSMTSPNKILDL